MPVAPGSLRPLARIAAIALLGLAVAALPGSARADGEAEFLPSPRDTDHPFICSLGPAKVKYDPKANGVATVQTKLVFDQIVASLCAWSCENKPRCRQKCKDVSFHSNPTVSNALTVTQRTHKSVIAYSPTFITNLSAKFGQPATFGVLAHEVGHHIDLLRGFAWMSNAWSRELRADAFAGCALARAGLSTDKMETALRAIAAYPTNSHPAWRQRQIAVRRGYDQCGGKTPMPDVKIGWASPKPAP